MKISEYNNFFSPPSELGDNNKCIIINFQPPLKLY